MISPSRRQFLGTTAAAATLAVAGTRLARSANAAAVQAKKPWFNISLAQWSLHRALKAGKLDNLDFAKVTKEEFGIEAVEYVNQFFKDKAENVGYLEDLKKRGEDLGVKTLLIMIDGEGALGDPDEARRTQAVENHYKWVTAAQHLGGHSIRVNARADGEGSDEEKEKRAADGLRRLSTFAADYGINVIVENHGGLSSNGAWLASVMRRVAMVNCGTLPDFGNFRIKGDQWYDRYVGVTELMPHAKAVSAKTHDFDESGNETKSDYSKLMKIVKDAGYRGYVGIEYEGGMLDEYAGVHASKKLLEKVRDELA